MPGVDPCRARYDLQLGANRVSRQLLTLIVQLGWFGGDAADDCVSKPQVIPELARAKVVSIAVRLSVLLLPVSPWSHNPRSVWSQLVFRVRPASLAPPLLLGCPHDEPHHDWRRDASISGSILPDE